VQTVSCIAPNGISSLNDYLNYLNSYLKSGCVEVGIAQLGFRYKP